MAEHAQLQRDCSTCWSTGKVREGSSSIEEPLYTDPIPRVTCHLTKGTECDLWHTRARREKK